jgi:probable addiction module antidote protein
MSKKKDKRSSLTVSYRAYLLDSLRDPQEAAGYLNAVLAEGDQAAFVLAIRDVAEAYGLDKLSAKTQLNRQSLVRALSVRGNPKLANVAVLLDALGMQLMVGTKRAA